MGFLSSANTIHLEARLTPIGKAKVMSGSTSVISQFSLGDSDANYYCSELLPSGFIPSIAGDIGTGSYGSNTMLVSKDPINSRLIVNNTGSTLKPVEQNSSVITQSNQYLGSITLSAAHTTQFTVNRTTTTDHNLNLWSSFKLPNTASERSTYTGLTTANGGFADTSFSGLAVDNIIVIAIDSTSLGETIDGKSIRLNLTTVSSAYTMYSTFENKGRLSTIEDAAIWEEGAEGLSLGNVAFLFSDQIKTPGNNPNLSWATGYGLNKPFTTQNKVMFNTMTIDTTTADTIVGVVYLDKGIAVITHPTIVNDYYAISQSANTVVTLNSVSTKSVQNILCLAGRGEFGSSTNTTFASGDTPRISEIGLYDASGLMIALAKTDQHLEKQLNDFKSFSIKITL